MPDGRYGTIVLGVGGMGSATTAHLARRGEDVLGLERFDIPHDRGSSHGVTRIIRMAQYEDPAYVPLVRRAYDLWRDLEAATGRDLLRITGEVDAGPPNSDLVAGARRSCAEHGLDHEVLAADQVNARFPGYNLPSTFEAVYQPDGGYLRSERGIVAHVDVAHDHGATIHARERVEDWKSSGERVRVTTDKASYEADRLVVTAGAWAGSLVDAITTLAVPERQVLAWLQPRAPDNFDPDTFPVFIVDTDRPDIHYYGLPVVSVPGFKFGRFRHRREDVDPGSWDREPTPVDARLLRRFAERFFPDGAGPTMRLSTCLFTNTPDGHFIIDTLPDHPTVTVGAGFSGHGYKFASVVGETLADLALDGDTTNPIEPFRLDRF